MDEQGKKKGKKATTLTLWLYFVSGALGSFVLLVCLHRCVVVLLHGAAASSTLASTISAASSTSLPVVDQGILRSVVKPPVVVEPAIPSPLKPAEKSSPISVQTADTSPKFNFFPPLPLKTNRKPAANSKQQYVESTEVQKESEKGQKQAVSILNKSLLCPADMVARYDQVPNGQQGARSDLEWCRRMVSQHRVSIGRSWGTLGRQEKLLWDQKKCNELVSLGKVQTCDERWGFKWFQNWASKKYESFYGGSNVTCIADLKTTTYCQVKIPSFTLYFSFFCLIKS